MSELNLTEFYSELAHQKASSQFIRAKRVAQPDCRTVICSTIDQLFKGMAVPVTFFYEEHLNISVLRESLETVLADFSIFAGRLKAVDHKLLLECNNAGVQFSHQTLNGSTAQMLKEIPTVDWQQFVDMIDPKRAIARQEPLLTVKVSHFTAGGTALGLCWHHALGDMHTFMQLMKAWSAAANGLSYEPPIAIEDRNVYIESQVADNGNNTPTIRYLDTRSLIGLMSYMLFRARRKTFARFYFSEDELNNMKQTLSQKAGQKLSRNDALCAHLCSWTAEFTPDWSGRYFGMPINCRVKTQLSKQALGNFIEVAMIRVDEGIQTHLLAKKIRHVVSNFESQYVSYFANLACIEKQGKEKISRFISRGVDPVNKTLTITNWTRFGVYDIIFSGSKPVYFTPSPTGGSSPPWLALIVEGFSQQGLLYSAGLPSKTMKRLMRPDALQKLHQYRSAEKSLSPLAQLPWVL